MAARKRFKIIISAVDKATRPLKKVQRQIRAIGKSMLKTGRTMSIALTAPIVAFGALTFKAAGDFEAAMLRVRGITKSNADEFKRLNDLAKELGSTTQFSASEAAGAMEELARAGFSVNEVLGALPSILELAASSNVTLEEASTIATGSMKGFGLEVSELTRINDLLVTANLKTKTTLISMAESLAKVAPTAVTAGISMEEIVATTGLLGDSMIDAQEAGTGLKTILLKITQEQTRKKLKAIGIDPKNLITSEGKVVSLLAILEEFERSGAGGRLGALGEIFGSRGANVVAALITKGSDALRELIEELDGPDSVGEAARQAAIRMEGFNGAMKALKSAVEGFQIAIGETGLLKTLTEITDRVTVFVRDLSKSNPLWLKWGTIMLGIVAVLGPMTIGVGLLAVAVGALNLALLPVIGAILVFAALAAVVISFWEPIQEFFDGLGETIDNIFGKKLQTAAKFASFFGFGAGTIQVANLLAGRNREILELAGATAGGGSLPVAPPAEASVNGKVEVDVRIESEVQARVTKLEASGDVEIAVDTGPGMSGL